MRWFASDPRGAWTAECDADRLMLVNSGRGPPLRACARPLAPPATSWSSGRARIQWTAARERVVSRRTVTGIPVRPREGRTHHARAALTPDRHFRHACRQEWLVNGPGGWLLAADGGRHPGCSSRPCRPVGRMDGRRGAFRRQMRRSQIWDAMGGAWPPDLALRRTRRDRRSVLMPHQQNTV
jgi:hypothetical protein